MAKKRTTSKTTKKVTRRPVRAASRAASYPMDNNTFIIIVGGAVIILILFFMMFVGHTQPSPKVSGENKATNMEEVQPSSGSSMLNDKGVQNTDNSGY